ncbi:ATP-binding cassette sub-family C member 5-like isoform X2 [Oratosquilla oratoria]|uniref:ATP-binding cassette sub-family C member 5-like isoform X2 n=1 Tax=Oratosquilla oratoria TaxID=337810 RepID=UPI003F768155
MNEGKDGTTSSGDEQEDQISEDARKPLSVSDTVLTSVEETSKSPSEEARNAGKDGSHPPQVEVVNSSILEEPNQEEGDVNKNCSSPVEDEMELQTEALMEVSEPSEPLLVPNTNVMNIDTLNEDESSIGDDEDMNEDIDDALDEGYMGIECTLERGFSLNESGIAQNLRHEKYLDIHHDYEPGSPASRYYAALRHLIPVRKKMKDRDQMPVDGTGLYSFASFSWMTRLMWKAYKKGLNEEDIPLCSKHDMADYNSQRLEHLWQNEIKTYGKNGASLQRAVWNFIKTRVILALFFFMWTLAMGFLGPTVFMRYLIAWISTDDPLSLGVCWTLGLIFGELCRIIFFGLVWSLNYRTGVRLRAACMGIIYKKLMRMSGVGDRSIGELINLFANDGQRIYDFAVLGPLIIGGPVVALGGVFYILFLLGPWALFGMLTFLLFYPFQFGISRLTGYFRRRTVTVTDERVRMMNELLFSVKLIKMYAWEKSFAKKISEIRERERVLLEKSAYVQSISLAMAPTVPVIAAIVTFLAHIGAGYNLTPAKAFCLVMLFTSTFRYAMSQVVYSVHTIVEGITAIDRYQGLTVIAFLLGNTRASFNMVRFSVRAIVEGIDSLGRIKRILLMDELTPYVKTTNDKHTAIIIKDATLAWNAFGQQELKKDLKNKRSDPPVDQLLLPKENEGKLNEVLFNLNLAVKKGELIGVCGSVGAGKSSLVSALLGQMQLQSGEVALNGSCAYVRQQAWILNTTLRENILLGENFDARRYYKVIYACSLTQDIEMLPGGDLTEIGERGINLSGGQKQRVSLARALYSNKDVYFLDDPLSAVDAHVGSHIFQWVIQGALRSKTTIFITHQLQYLPHCDRIIYLCDGHIAEVGTHLKLMKEDNGYAGLYKAHMETVHNQEKSKNRVEKQVTADSVASFLTRLKKSGQLNKNSVTAEIKKGQLMTEEKLEKGNIPMSVYKSYIHAAGGYIIASLVILTFAANVGSTTFSSWWLSYWLSAGGGNTTIIVGNETVTSDNIADNPDRHFYQLVYGLTIVVILATSLLRGFTFMKTTLKASSSMHDKVFVRVFQSPMSFFDTTPSGRIINIFSRDMDEVDVRVPFTMETFLQNIWLIVSSLLFVCLVFPYFLFVLVFLTVLFMFIRTIFRVGIRDFKRMENISRSPLYSHVNTTVNGLATIHAYGKQEMFTRKFMTLFDENSCSFYLFNCAMRWLAIRLDLLALSVTATTALMILILRGSVEASFAGLALAYAAQLSGIFQFTVRLSTETEARFTSVQRINNYIKGLLSEAPSILESHRPEVSWPKRGRISFQNVYLRYRPDTPIVLKGVNIDIDAEEKIGVVGRTGSGKSSLGMALFRMVELTEGKICIDNVDISSIGLEDLRSKLSIIPQDPVLFIGTVRYNLDPFEKHSDEEVWDALEQTYMRGKISALDLKLLAPVVENGENFSVGERQLLCMARALLRRSKILFLDEATAAIDTETDALIQNTLKNAFINCTMITIAHRLNTVMSCTRIMVMDDGKVVEFDSPDKLLANPTSVFSKMLTAAESSFMR